MITKTKLAAPPHVITGHVPQVIITMTPDGELCAELPGFQATRRKVPLKAGKIEASLRRILNDQLDGHYEIGADGAPTQAQVKHWENHSIWPDDRCRFCLAEGRAHSTKKKLRSTLIAKTGDVEVRKLQPVKTKAEKRAASYGEIIPVVCSRKIEDLDL